MVSLVWKERGFFVRFCTDQVGLATSRYMLTLVKQPRTHVSCDRHVTPGMTHECVTHIPAFEEIGAQQKLYLSNHLQEVLPAGRPPWVTRLLSSPGPPQSPWGR